MNLQSIEMAERTALQINSCRPCQPLGAIYASLGVHACLPLSHGSPGCVRFHRTLLQNHFRKSIKAVTSVLKEEAAVFGGESNLRAAIKTAFDAYDPEVIAVHTTCLSETIGDDVGAILSDIAVPAGKHIVWASTPSYTGGCIDGFAAMLCGFIDGIAELKPKRNSNICVFAGMVNPGDLYEIKWIIEQFGKRAFYIPDFCGVLDVHLPERMDAYAPGGIPAGEIAQIGGARSYIAMGRKASWMAGERMRQKFGMEGSDLHLPIGMAGTDVLLKTMVQITGQKVPGSLIIQRDGLAELIVESAKYLFCKKVAIYADPDIAVALCSFLADIGMLPVVAATAQPDVTFEKQVMQIYADHGINGIVRCGCDAYEVGRLAEKEQVSFIMGESRGACLSRELKIPYVRIGFPVTDRYGGPLQTICGYRGGIRIIEMITNALLDRMDEQCYIPPKTR